MSVDNYQDLLEHAGHKIKCVTYGMPGDPANVAIECDTCATVLLDFNRPHRFVVIARTRDNPIHDQISLLPVTLPEDDLTNGAANALLRYSAVAHTIHKERWEIVTDGAGEPIFFNEEFAAFEALWALANNPQAYNDIITLVTRLTTYLKRIEDKKVQIIEEGEPIVANHLVELADAIDVINL